MRRPKSHILFVDDDPDVLYSGALWLRENGYRVDTLQDPESLPAVLAKELPDLVILDMNFRSEVYSGNEGFYWMRQLLNKWKLRVVMITAYGEIELAVRAMKEGASDFLSKPWKNEKLLDVVERNAKRGRGARPATQRGETTGVIGRCPQILSLLETVRKIAPTDASVLLTGENGTGKEVLARAIHAQSKRAAKPFVTVDLGAIPDSLFESELFGYRKGAFTDAREDHPGKFEQAQGGTLFLDELGNLPLHQQSKLLVAIQSREIRPLGSAKPLPLDIRVIAATNANLEDLVEKKLFRQDLHYRLNTVTLELIPLRERGEDILLLARHFLDQYTGHYEKNPMDFSVEAIAAMNAYPWPGNVRELSHVIERAVILSESDRLKASDLSLDSERSLATAPDTRPTTLESMEKQAIAMALQQHQGNISMVAQELGLSRAALYRRLSKYKL